MAATGTPRLSSYSTPATPATRGLSAAPATAQQNAQLLSSSQQLQGQQQQTPPLPPPAIFDVLPHLHALLNRLLIQKPTDASAAQAGAGGGGEEGGKGAAGGEEGSKAGGAAAGAGAGTSAAPSAANADPDAQPLEIHQLAAASSALKVRLQKARQACTRLGDMDRTVDEQQEEIDELEERVSKLKAVLEEMGVGATTTESRATVGGDGANSMVLRAARPI